MPTTEIDTCTAELAAILNISNAARDHKAHCDHNCCVSLFGLKQAAALLLPRVLLRERRYARELIEKMPIT